MENLYFLLPLNYLMGLQHYQKQFTGSNGCMHGDEGAEISKTVDYGHKLSEKWKYLFRHSCTYYQTELHVEFIEIAI